MTGPPQRLSSWACGGPLPPLNPRPGTPEPWTGRAAGGGPSKNTWRPQERVSKTRATVQAARAMIDRDTRGAANPGPERTQGAGPTGTPFGPAPPIRPALHHAGR